MPSPYIIAQKYTHWDENQNNTELRAYFKKYLHEDFNPATTPWCAEFMNAVLTEAGVVGTGHPNARSFLSWGKAVDIKDIEQGDVLVFRRGSNNWEGHVTFFVQWTDDTHRSMVVFGGNQNNCVCAEIKTIDHLIGIRRANTFEHQPNKE